MPNAMDSIIQVSIGLPIFVIDHKRKLIAYTIYYEPVQIRLLKTMVGFLLILTKTRLCCCKQISVHLYYLTLTIHFNFRKKHNFCKYNEYFNNKTLNRYYSYCSSVSCHQ